jgi:hypothetical protein
MTWYGASRSILIGTPDETNPGGAAIGRRDPVVSIAWAIATGELTPISDSRRLSGYSCASSLRRGEYPAPDPRYDLVTAHA